LPIQFLFDPKDSTLTTRRYDVNLACIVGGRLRKDFGFASQGNLLYDLATAQQVDGCILWTLALSEMIDPATVAEFYERFASLSCVTISAPLPNQPSALKKSMMTLLWWC
jgi:hypothetical protein